MVQRKPLGTGTFNQVKTFTQLTAAGVTAAIEVEGMKDHTFQIVLASVDTNVIVEVQGTVDGTSFFPLTIDSTAQAGYAITANRVTLTTDGNHGIVVKNTPLLQIRFNFVSESGGTAATLDVKYHGQN